MTREEAIQALNEIFDDSEFSRYEAWYGGAMDMAIEALKAEQVHEEWIPVSERLPDSDRPVLVTIQWADFDSEVTVGEYWDNPTKAAPESEKGWGTYGDHVTAWREMPEPYKEGNNAYEGGDTE